MNKFFLMKVLPKLVKEVVGDVVTDKTMGLLSELAKFHLYFLIAALGLAAFAYIVMYFVRRLNGSFSLDYGTKMSRSDFRKAFCLSMLMNIILIVVLFAVSFKFVDAGDVAYMSFAETAEVMLYFLELAGMLLTILIFGILSFVWSVRRLNDMGKSGLWVLLMFVPIVNLYVIFMMLFTKGESESQSAEDVIPLSESILSKLIIVSLALTVAANGVFEFVNAGTPKTNPNDIMLGHKLINGNWTSDDQEYFYVSLDEINEMPYEVISVSKQNDNTVVSLAVDNATEDPIRLNMTFNDNDWFSHMRLDNLTFNLSKDFYNSEDVFPNHPMRNIDLLFLVVMDDDVIYLDTSSIELINSKDASNVIWKVNLLYCDGHSDAKKSRLIFELLEGRPCVDLGSDRVFLDAPSQDKYMSLWQMSFLMSYYYIFGHKYGT